MHTLLPALLALQSAASDGSRLGQILRNIPRDPLSIFVYVALVGAALLIYLGNRSSGKPPAPPRENG